MSDVDESVSNEAETVSDEAMLVSDVDESVSNEAKLVSDVDQVSSLFHSYEVSNIETCHKRKVKKEQTNKVKQTKNYYTTVYTIKSKGDNNIIFDTVHIFSSTAKLLLRL